jgi:hypothetical protein
MSFWRTAMLWPALLAVTQITDTAAQTLPVMGYVAAKNANPKRLEVFKQGLDTRQDRHVMSQALRQRRYSPVATRWLRAGSDPSRSDHGHQLR